MTRKRKAMTGTATSTIRKRMNREQSAVETADIAILEWIRIEDIEATA